MRFINNIYHSFPVKLVAVHLKYNQFLLLYWVVLFSIIEGSFGRMLGIPYLFLDPVYMQKVNFWSFMIMGVVLAGFSMAFNITSYILDGFRFPFLGTLPRPFSHFCLNNALIPSSFLIFYMVRIAWFQREVESAGFDMILGDLLGLFFGYLVMLFLMFFYFSRTNRDIFKVLAIRADKKKKSNRARRNAFRKLRRLRRTPVKVDSYLSLKFRFFSTKRFEEYYDRVAILKVFNQNQRNAIRIELLIFIIVILLGLFKTVPRFQIPAASSGVLLLTMIVMFTGAVSYWFRYWSVAFIILLFFGLNYTYQSGILSSMYKAYGLNYDTEKADYNLNVLEKINSSAIVRQDKSHTLKILDHWRSKFEEEKPPMILITSSGGGQRSALWTMNVLQHANSALGGRLMRHTMLMTGASGGLIGAGYYRDLYFDKIKGMGIDPDHKMHLDKIANDVLNPVIFTLLVNDIFIKFQSFTYAGQKYRQERGYAFEEKLVENLDGRLNRKLSDYKNDEFYGRIPMVLISPTIVNDGRKLYISPQPVSYFNIGMEDGGIKKQGVDFRFLLKEQHADSLRFVTALRMNATFPYITPNVSLPTNPAIQVADAGVSDNFGISDALTFLYVFRDWIRENTSKVILVSIRDSAKEEPINSLQAESLSDKLFSPLQGVYSNWGQVQTVKNEKNYGLLKSVYNDHLQRVEFEYSSTTEEKRASLSWRLMKAERDDVIGAIHSEFNQRSLNDLAGWFE